MMERCEICGRLRFKLYRHHVVPRAEGGKNGKIARCCRTCASQVHMLFTVKELAKMTLEELKTHPLMQKYLAWIKDQDGEYAVKLSNRLK